jgi:Tol biopolymer transport system component
LWERSITGGHERQLASSERFRYSKPRWSPDGAKLAYSRTEKNSTASAVVVLNTADGREQVLTKPGEMELIPWDWSSDGTTILGACRFSRSERFAACLMPVIMAPQVGGPTIRVVASDPKRDLFCVRFSTNQRWITMLALDPEDLSASTLYVVAATGGKWIPVTDGASFDDKPRWGPDGRMIYFVSNRSGVPNVWGRRFEPGSDMPIGEPFPVTTFTSMQFMLTSRTGEMDIAVTPTELLLPISESRGDIWMLDQVDK